MCRFYLCIVNRLYSFHCLIIQVISIFIVSQQGSVYLFDEANPSSVEPIFETHFGNFVGVSVLSPGTTQCVVRIFRTFSIESNVFAPRILNYMSQVIV